MEEIKDQKFDVNHIFCSACKNIKPIKINSNWKERTIDISFECDRERNAQPNYKTNFSENDELYFYCKTHKKKFNAYCEECKNNFCEDCTCSHDIKSIKSKYDYYFSNSQIEELISTYEEAQNVISIIYSLECNNKLCSEFENYYNIYTLAYNNGLFHINIIYNINLFYNYFKFLITSRLVHTGFFSILDINNIKDSTIFFDSSFKNQFSDLLDKNTFNFDNVLNLFLLSKRFENKTDLFLQFSNKIHSLVYINALAVDNIEKDKNKMEKCFNDIRFEIIKKENDLIKIQNEITNQILSIKLLKIAVPSNLKRKLISILQREVIKKYKNYLHKVKPNSFILNNIKKKYESFKKQNKGLYTSLQLDEKVNIIDDILSEKNENSTFIDNVYFDQNFDNKNLMNTFIFFTQKLHFGKSNETHYSNREEGKIFPINQLMIEFQNDNKNKNLNGNKDETINLNNTNKDGKDNISNVQINNEPFNNSNENINNNRIMKYKNLLTEYKINFDNSYNDILIKQKLKFECIMDALFKNDFSFIIENAENKNTEFDNFINDCVLELNEIKYEEDEKQKQLNKLLSQIKSNNFQEKRKNIFSALLSDRKYKNQVQKIQDNYHGNNTNEEVIRKYYGDLARSLVELGGFDDRNAYQIISIIANYLYYSEEIKTLDKEMETYNNYSNENAILYFEINQLKRIRNYIQQVNDDLKNYNTYYELNEMDKIKQNFENKTDYYIKKANDTNFGQALHGIKEFIKGKDISFILESLKNACKDIESNFYVDESLNLVSYCWAIQNGHDFIVDS